MSENTKKMNDIIQSINQLSSIKKTIAMRKSFTRLFSLIMFVCMIFLQAAAYGAAPAVITGGQVPADGYLNYNGTTGQLIVTLTFNQNVQPGAAHAGIIGLYKGGEQLDPIQISGATSTNPLTSSTVEITNNVVTITFNRTMVQGETYFVTASADALMNSAGEYWAGYGNADYDITIGDFTVPEIAKVGTTTTLDLTPRVGNRGEFALGDNLVAVFTENIAFNTGNIGIYTAAGNVVELFDVATSANVSIVGGTNLTINPSANLTELETYYVRIAPTAITDASMNSNPFAGINNNTGWWFQAKDVTAPELTFVPPTGEDDIQQGAPMTINFSDNRTAAGLSFEIRKTATGTKYSNGSNVQSVVVFQYDNAGAWADVPTANYTATYTTPNKITIAWTTGNGFDHLEDYRFGILTNSFYDESGNPVTTGLTSTFTAGDFEAPIITINTVEAAGADGAASGLNDDTDDLELKKIFMEVDLTDFSGVDKVYYWIVAYNAGTPSVSTIIGGGKTLTLSTTVAGKYYGFDTKTGANVDLASKTKYDVYFAATDKATVKNTSKEFTAVVTDKVMKADDVETSDTEAPIPTAKVNTVSANNVTVTSGTPVSNVKYDSPVTITFNETVVAVTGNITVKYQNPSTLAWGTLTAGGTDYTFTFAANQITIEGAHADIAVFGVAKWKSSGTYRVYIDNNEIPDVITGTGTPNKITEKIYEFTVQDYTGPIAYFKNTTSDTKTGVATTANIEVDLGEACTRADGTAITSSNVFFRDVTGGGTIVPADITISGGRYITIDPTSALADENNYSIELTATIKDAAGNPLAYYKDNAGGTTQVTGADEFLLFSTADETDPIITFTPADGSSGLDKTVNGVQVGVSIGEQVYTAMGDVVDASDNNFLRTLITFERVSDGLTYMFDLNSNTSGVPSTFNIDPFNADGSALTAYDAEESYKVTINGLYDATGNPITNNSTTFTIREYGVPSILVKSPADNEPRVAANTGIQITFNEPVKGVAGKNITIINDAPGTWNAGAPLVIATATIAPTLSNVVTINEALIPDLLELGTYHIILDAGAFEDAVGNVCAAISSATAWNFSAFDNTRPVIANQTTDVTPNDGATTTTVPTQIVINFTEASGKIVAGPGKIYIRETGNTGLPDFTFQAQASEVHIVGTTVSIDVDASGFEYDGDYWVEIEADAFKDEAGNYFLGYIADQTLWNFTINSDPAPQYDVANSSPKDGANDVSLTNDLALHFTEPVDFKTGTVPARLTIYDADATSEHTVINFNGSTVEWSWNSTHDVLYIQHDAFDANTNYYVLIDDNVFVDAGGNTMGGAIGELDGVGEWNFTTEDLTDPQVASITVNGVSVADALNPNPTGISKSHDIVVVFDEPVTIATPNASVQLNGGALGFTATLTNGNTLTINPTNNFLSEATITVTTIAGQIYDKAQFPRDFGAHQIGQFVVEDYQAPSWDDATATVTPGNNKFVISNLSVNEDDCKVYYYVVNAGTLTTMPAAATVKTNKTGVVSVDDADTGFEITGLLGDHNYDIYFVAEDDIPNLMTNAGVIKRTASTLDNVNPVLTTSTTGGYAGGLLPNDGADCVDPSGTFKLKFNENVQVLDATKFWIRRADDNTSVTLASVTASTVYVTITPAAALDEVTDYYIEINPGAIADNPAGNAWEEIFYGTTRWNFTTADVTQPIITSKTTKLSPKDDDTDVPVAASNSLVMTFNEPMAKNTTANVFIDIYRTGAATPHEKINVLSDAVQVNGTVVTINRSNIYASETSYYVLIPANAFYDQACTPNNFAGYTVATDWNFTTEDITAPEIDFFYDDATTEIDPSVAVNSTSDINNGIKIKFWNPVTSAYENLYKNGTLVSAGYNVGAYFKVTKSNGSTLTTTSTYTGGVVTITGAYTSNETYTVTFTNLTGTSLLGDVDKNGIANSSVQFNTEDRLSPIVTITAESKNTINEALVGTRFIVEFDKPIIKHGGTDENVPPTAADLETANYLTFQDVTAAPANVAYTVTVLEAGKKYAVDPVAAALGSEHDYRLIWTANLASGTEVKDELYFPNGNVLSRTLTQRTFDFTTEDVVNPQKDGLTPALGGTPATLTADIEISFDEAVKKGNGNIEIRYANGQIFDVIDINDCDFTGATTGGFNVAIPHDPFPTFMGFYVVIPAGAIVDNSFNENEYAGFLNNTTWNFSTDDGTPPDDIILSPENGEPDIAVNSNLEITFDENIQVGAGNLVIYFNNGDTGADGNAIEIIPIADARVTISGTNPVDANHVSDKVTINPDMQFDFNAPGEYYIRIDEGWVKDLAGNDYDGINDNDTWKFLITDPTVPTLNLASLYPAQNDVNIPQVLTDVTMTFDRAVLPGTGYIRLYQYYYNAATYAYETKLIEKIDVTTLDIPAAGSATVTFDIATRLLDDMVYYFLADNGSFTNTASSRDWWGGITDPFVWRFTTLQDVIAPQLAGDLSASVSMFGATCVDPDAVTLSLTFDEGVKAGAGNLVITKVADGTTTNVPASQATFVNNVATFTIPTSTLADKTEYYVTLEATAVSDTARVPNAWDSSVIAANAWTFYTGDYTAPTLDDFTPVNGTDNLANSFPLTMTFSENVQPGDGTLVVTRLDNNDIVYNAALTAEQIDANVVTVELTGLIDGKTYAVSFGPGLVTDLAYTSNGVECGNLNGSVALATTWQFTIDDNAAPVIAGKPMGENEKSTVTIEITATEEVTSVAGKLVTISAASQSPIEILVTDMVTTDNKVFTAEVAGLVDNTSYTVTVASGAFIDAAVIPNETEAISWTFKTGDNTSPIVEGTTPTGNIGSYIGVELTVTFNEAVTKGAGSITIGTMEIPVSSENVTISEDGTVVTIVPTSNLTFTSYVVTVDAGAFVDGNDNPSPVVTWNFAIVDNAFNASCMSADHFLPYDNSTGVYDDINLEITFCEIVVPGTGKVKLFEMVTAGNTLFEDYDITAGMISADGKTVSIPVTGLKDFTSYGVLIDADAVRDEAGNSYAGLADPTFWNFTTGDNTAPTVVSVTPATETNALNTFAVAIEFSEDVVNVAQNVSVSTGTVVVTGSGKSYVATITAADGAVVDLTIGTGIKDASERNNLEAAVVNTYTVGDNTRPTILSVVAPEAPIATSFSIVVTFSEPVTSIIEDPINITGGDIDDAELSEDATVLTLYINAEEEAEVTIEFTDEIIDMSVNQNKLVPMTVTYTIGDFTAPTVSAAPATGTNMDAEFNVVLTFSDDAIVTNNDINVDGETSSNITNVGNVFTVSITAPDMTTVTVTVAATVADEAGNVITGDRVFTYQTGDNTAPELITVNPNGLATPDAHPTKLEMFFVENVVIGTGKLVIYKQDGTQELEIAASSATADNKVVTIPMPRSLDKNATYYVLVDEGFVTDANANKFVGISSTSYWTFTTGDFKTDNNPVLGSLEFKVYPNPFVNELKVDNASELSRIVITSMTGQKVKEIVNPTSTIQTNELRSGVYFISLYVDDVVAETKRIVKR